MLYRGKQGNFLMFIVVQTILKINAQSLKNIYSQDEGWNASIIDYDENNTEFVYDNNHVDVLDVYENVRTWKEIFNMSGLLITSIGIILNSVCIWTFYKSQIFQNSSFSYYIYALSIVDSLNLAIRFIIPQLAEMSIRSVLKHRFNATTPEQYDMHTPEILNDLYCGTMMYVHNSLGFFSTWIMVGLSLERWLVIKYPKKADSEIKHNRTFWILFSIFSICSITNIFDFSNGFYVTGWFSNITLLCEPVELYNNGTQVKISFGLMSINTEIFTCVRAILQAICPFFIAFMFNLLALNSFKKKHSGGILASILMMSVYLPVTDTNQTPTYMSKCLKKTQRGSHWKHAKKNLDIQSPTEKILFDMREKNKLNSKKDCMLLALSLMVLLTQLPVNIAWYLIYYRLVLQYIQNIYIAAHSPILIYILRIFEMSYFGLKCTTLIRMHFIENINRKTIIKNLRMSIVSQQYDTKP
jgi:hypothetical protein